MNSNEKEVAFLAQVLSYDDSQESRKLTARVVQAHSDDRCVRRVLCRSAWLFVLAGGVMTCWGGFFSDHIPSTAWPSGDFLANSLCAVGLGSLVSCLVLVGLGAIYRKRLDLRREEARKFVATVLQTRLGKPAALPVLGIPTGGSGWRDRNRSVGAESEKIGLALASPPGCVALNRADPALLIGRQ